MRVAINGFGRIGRTLARMLWSESRHELVHVNDLIPDPENLAYLLQNDSNYGRFPARVRVRGNAALEVENGESRWDVGLTSHRHVAEVDWKKTGAEVVIEATGATENEAACSGLPDGDLRHVVVTQRTPFAEATLVRGVNEGDVAPRDLRVISASTCDATAIAPVVACLLRSFGIRSGFLTTLHPWLSYQNLVDSALRSVARPNQYQPDFSLGRASPGALLPKPTTAATAVEEVLPQLSGRFLAASYRVPTSVVCYADLALLLERPAKLPEILEALDVAGGVIRSSDEPLISTDLIGERASAVVCRHHVAVREGGAMRLSIGYDNEWGYASRVHDLLDDLHRS